MEYNFNQNKEGVDYQMDIKNKKKYKIAVTSKYKMLVDLHFGHAEEFHIYEVDDKNIVFIETRNTMKYCTGQECDDVESQKLFTLQTIADCDGVLTMRIGYDAQKRLSEKGLFVVQSCESIEEGLRKLVLDF